MLDAWQSQARSTQQDLATLQQQAEVLRQRNTSLSTELSASFATKRQLQDELSEQSKERNEVASALARCESENDALGRELDSISQDCRESKIQLKRAIELALQGESSTNEQAQMLQGLEVELHSSRAETTRQHQIAKQIADNAAVRISELEKERSDLK